MATVTDGIGRQIAEIKLDDERVYPITHAEVVVIKEGPSTGANKGVFLDEELQKIEDAIDEAQTAVNNEQSRAQEAEGLLQADIDAIDAAIPSQASSSNQLADKAFVNSSISTATATFRGTYNLITDLQLAINATQAQIAAKLKTTVSGVDNNDYVFVQIPTSASTPTEISRIDRYKYNGTAWAFEYSLNNSGFTAAQWAAINSGITSTLLSELVSAIGSAVQPSDLLKYVRVDTTQSFTTTEKTQGRNNIGAASTAAATTSANGLMSSTDKVKLDKIACIEIPSTDNQSVVIPSAGGCIFTYNSKPIEFRETSVNEESDNSYYVFAIRDYPLSEGTKATAGRLWKVIRCTYDPDTHVLSFYDKYENAAQIPAFIMQLFNESLASATAKGLMSATDKAKLDSFEIVVASDKYDPSYSYSNDPVADFGNN